MNRSGAALLLCVVVACAKEAPSHGGAFSDAPGLSVVAASPAPPVIPAPPTTAPGIALGNLDSQIRGRRAVLDRNPGDVDSARQVVELLLARGQYTGRVADYEAADAMAAALANENPESADARLVHASTLSTFHRFAAALDEIGAAERANAPSPGARHARAMVYVGQGRFDEAEALGLWREPSGRDATELATAAVVAGERGLDADSERLFEKAGSSYRDVSPFPVAWVTFQHGWLLERKGDRARAKAYYGQACDALPTYAHACVHMAALGTPERAAAVLEPLIKTSDDPEVMAAYADALRRSGRAAEASPIALQARARYDELMTKHPEAFADHAASFYLGLGHDARRALGLAKMNAANRNTEQALDLWITAALAAGDRDDACSAQARAATLGYLTPSFRATIDALRGGCSAPHP